MLSIALGALERRKGWHSPNVPLREKGKRQIISGAVSTQEKTPSCDISTVATALHDISADA